jgi:phosphoglycolate phosphatase-like HAD superfamily hydrolase
LSLRLAFDFDGTLAQGKHLSLRPGAAEALAALKKAGHHLVLHSCRCTPFDPSPQLEEEAARWYQTGEVSPRVTDQWERFAEMRDFLRAAGLWGLFDEVWQHPGKPEADRMFDDLCEEPDWPRVELEFGGIQ